ncbi:hypothetical protein LLS1_01460 [Leifsonia sp. LS1]|uniref:TniQ family protein n=1 Tax=Leifsonia sp. LS1 TaxID=2828483 RepID=UPI001CFC8E62|nr:TniQ family protein [Leifsonia sp. LS1]GIT78477.1 hypothetical protein LLS1_01460 [Leifsonia sp. LS1]
MNAAAPGRLLGAPVTLHQGEWLQSAISRWAWDIFGVSRGALIDAMGLAHFGVEMISTLGTRLYAEPAQALAYATGLPRARLHEATMESQDGKLIWLNRTREDLTSATVLKDGMWTWQAGTRYCPDCLAEAPGVFQLIWRSPWVYACLLHKRILLDACPVCHHDLVEMRSRNRDPFDPSTCRANIAPGGATRQIHCLAALTETWDNTPIRPDSAPFRAQQHILTGRGAPAQKQLLWLLQSAATGLRGAKAFQEIAELSGMDPDSLAGLFDEEPHVGISPPKNAYAMAALIGAAYTLTHSDESAVAQIIRSATFTRPPARPPRDVGFGPGSPRELLARWPHAPTGFRQQILRSLDPDLTTGQRILWDTAGSGGSVSTHGGLRANGDKRATGIPLLLWPEWCSRFDLDGPVIGPTLAAALATAVRAVGTAETDPDETRLARVLRPRMLGTPEQTDRLLAGISELAGVIDRTDPIINYQRRLSLPAAELLPQEHWRLLAESIAVAPGHTRLHRNARRYLWQRLTLTPIPPELRAAARDDAAEYTVFTTRMTAELQAALDQYGEAFLHNHAIYEPVTWSPETAATRVWPGADILDLDLELLHSLLSDGVYTHHRLRDALRIPIRRVLRAIDAAPPSTGKAVTTADWSTLLPPTGPDASRRPQGSASPGKTGAS